MMIKLREMMHYSSAAVLLGSFEAIESLSTDRSRSTER